MTKQERLEKEKQRFEEMKNFESPLYEKGYGYIGGIDEVGRGCLAGPVVSACVVLGKDFDVMGIDDSKKLSEKKREELYGKIMEKALAVGVAFVDNRVIDDINILEATKVAMEEGYRTANKALKEKYGKSIDYLIIDALKLPNIALPQLDLVKGDSKSLSVAAASIVAKVTRDNYMKELAKTYEGYAFEKNKGYGTKAHYEGIRERGISPYHRKSFLKNIDY